MLPSFRLKLARQNVGRILSIMKCLLRYGLRALLVLAGSVCILSQASADSTHSTAEDVSWPNCKVTQIDHGAPAIIGVTGGLDFHPNPCLENEALLTGNNYALYMNTGYPGPMGPRHFPNYPRACDATNTLCLAYNYGYNAARYAVNYANKQAVHTSVWWLDVETSNSWTNNVLQNRETLVGMADALRHYTVLPTIGFYSYPGQWNLLTGNWQPHYPGWVATGSLHYSVALQACHQPSFTGGPVWLAQYTTKLDHNIVCGDAYPKAFRL